MTAPVLGMGVLVLDCILRLANRLPRTRRIRQSSSIEELEMSSNVSIDDEERDLMADPVPQLKFPSDILDLEMQRFGPPNLPVNGAIKQLCESTTKR